MTDYSHGGRKEGHQQSGKNDSVGTTIVGARPQGRNRGQAEIPRGIEVLMKKASVDPEFRQTLLDKRARAADEIGLELSDVETAMLNGVPGSQIEKIIENTTVPDEHRRVFLGKIGTAMVAVLTLGLSGSDQAFSWEFSTGSRPERRTQVPQRRGPEVVKSERERLRVRIRDEGVFAIFVTVTYECPFKEGEITVHVENHRLRWRKFEKLYVPMQHDVVKGRGEVTFHVSGNGGRTDRLLVQLRANKGWCKGIRLGSARLAPPMEMPGEYTVEGCVVWRIEEYRKKWQA